jgi:hypothetical protein
MREGNPLPVCYFNNEKQGVPGACDWMKHHQKHCYDVTWSERDRCEDKSCGNCPECNRTTCPENSVGNDVHYGCICQDGYYGTITRSESTPYYTGSCELQAESPN